jgi:hypothetical protein
MGGGFAGNRGGFRGGHFRGEGVRHAYNRRGYGYRDYGGYGYGDYGGYGCGYSPYGYDWNTYCY